MATKQAGMSREEREENKVWELREAEAWVDADPGHGSARLRKAHKLGLLGQSMTVYREERQRILERLSQLAEMLGEGEQARARLLAASLRQAVGVLRRQLVGDLLLVGAPRLGRRRSCVLDDHDGPPFLEQHADDTDTVDPRTQRAATTSHDVSDDFLSATHGAHAIPSSTGSRRTSRTTWMASRSRNEIRSTT